MPSHIVAAVQLPAHERAEFPAAWPLIVERVRAAALQGAALVVLPEGTLPAYVLGDESFEPDETAAQLAQCLELCRELRVVLVAGAARRSGKSVFNSAVVIDSDGTVAGTYDKRFLWDFDRHWFRPGSGLDPVETSLGKLGVMVCADGRIPTLARELVDRGAQVLVMPTAWVTSGRDPSNLENVQADLLARVRARENGVPLLAANKCGVELGCVAYCGKSQVVAADGTLLAIASTDGPETISAEVPFETASPARAESPFIERRARGGSISMRVALSSVPRAQWTTRQTRTLGADAWIDSQSCSENLRERAVSVSDDRLLDPGYLAQFRLSGFDLAIWTSSMNPEWQLAFARSRALELRMYLAVFDTPSGRAYAVDPDGTIVCGTFGAYAIARLSFEPQRAAQTLVAPGSDIIEGLNAVRAAAAR